MRSRWAPVLLAFALLATPAQALRMAGVYVPERVVVEDTPLILNGAGVRWYMLAKVYVGALYLPERMDTTDAILQTPAPKSIFLHLLRDVTAEQVVADSLDRFRANASDAAYARLRERIDRFNGALPDLQAGDVVRIDLVHPERTHVWVDDQLLATIPGRDFQAAVLKLWLGDHPADERLKQAMLGKNEQDPTGSPPSLGNDIH